MKRNITYIGKYVDDEYKDNFKLKDINKFIFKEDKFNLVNVSSVKEIKRKQGFLAVLEISDLYEIDKAIDWFDDNSVYKVNVYELDRKFRKYFKNFEYVIILITEEFDYGHIPFSNIYVEYKNKYLDNEDGLNILIKNLYEEYSNKKEIKFTKKRWENIEKINIYLKKTRKKFFTTNELLKKFKVNEKWLQRYLKDVNRIYHNIGYNKKKRLWYVIKYR